MNTQPFSETGYKLSGCGFEQVAVTYTSDIAPVSSKEFHDNKATIECRFTIKRVRGTIRTYRKNLFFFYLSKTDYIVLSFVRTVTKAAVSNLQVVDD